MVTADEAVERGRRMIERPGRALVGIAGAPGAGKSTLASRLAAELGPVVTVVPMDGFHLADVSLERLGLRSWKGRIDTFDGWGYLALLQRLRHETEHTVFAPAFERDLEQPLAGAVAVDPACRLVVTEGNYLLHDAEPWTSVRGALDEVWFVETDEAERSAALLERHVQFGKSRAAATEWVDRVDRANAALVAAGRSRADVVIRR